MAKRKAPGATRMAMAMAMPEQDKHEGMLSQMHDALYALGDKIRKPFARNGEKLLPKKLQSGESPESKAARGHIEALHAAMKGCKSDGKE